jgi:hypothetical protein
MRFYFLTATCAEKFCFRLQYYLQHTYRDVTGIDGRIVNLLVKGVLQVY